MTSSNDSNLLSPTMRLTKHGRNTRMILTVVLMSSFSFHINLNQIPKTTVGICLVLRPIRHGNRK